MVNVKDEYGNAASAAPSDDGEGWIVKFRRDGDGESERVYYPYKGGAWELKRDGTEGRQLEGTADVRAPRSAARMRTFLKNAL